MQAANAPTPGTTSAVGGQRGRRIRGHRHVRSGAGKRSFG